MGFANSLDREAAFLKQSPRTDGLPDLTAIFNLIQARRPRTPSKRANKQLYVLHAPTESAYVMRTTNQRAMFTNQLMLHLIWPVQSSTGKAEDDQLAFEQAIDAVITVVLDLVGDHTHGTANFLSVAEDPYRIRVRFPDPIEGIKNANYEAFITYGADDPEISN